MKRLDAHLTEQDTGRLRHLLISADALPCERKRYFALWHVGQGDSALHIERLGIMNADSVRKTIHDYRRGGLDALKEREHPGRQSVLTDAIRADLRSRLASDERVWNAGSLVEHLQEHFGVTLSRTALRNGLRQMGMSWQRTRYVVAGQADPAEKEAFKADLESVKRGR